MNNFTQIKDLMDRLTSWVIPGNSVKIYVKNEEVFSYQSGYSDLENRIPMRGNELFNIYSCSKIATVTAAMQLYEKGYFLLDDPLYDFIPEYREMYIEKENHEIVKAQKPITLRNLFTMTSGLSYNTNILPFDKAREVTDGKMNTLPVIKLLAQQPLLFEPGETWMYGLSHDILAAVVEVVSGKLFREYVRENIFEPLEMKESFYHNNNILDRVAPQYRFIDNAETNIVKLQSAADITKGGHVEFAGKEVELIFGSEYDSGGAGITTSVSDYVKFLSALANGGVGANGEKILSKGSIRLMTENHLNDQQLKNFNWEQLKGYGYGLGVRTMMDRVKSGSIGNIREFGWGGAAGATALMDAEIGVAMFYTHHMLNPQEAYYQPRIRNTMYACLKQDLIGRSRS